MLAAARFVGEHGGVKNRADIAPRAACQGELELQPLAVDGDGKLNGAIADSDRRRNGKAPLRRPATDGMSW